MKTKVMCALACIMLVAGYAPLTAAAKLALAILPSGELMLAVDPALHLNYGLAYPVTYRIGIPTGSASLHVDRRYSSGDSWHRLTEKTTNDFFNAEEVVRFDYAANLAYVSVPFGSSSDTVYVRISNLSDQTVSIGYQGICNYYDNRVAAVTVTADDYMQFSDAEFDVALHIFRSYNLWTTAAIITGPYWCTAQTWSKIQSQLDSGYVEAASHGRDHIGVPYPDPASEVTGSKTDIISNLNLPAQFRNGTLEYVYTWVAPYGQYDDTAAAYVARNKFLLPRMASVTNTGYSTWDPVLSIYGVRSPNIEFGGVAGDTVLTELNAAFDNSINAGHIYAMLCHPQGMLKDWQRPYATGHLGYISGRKNLWYASYGQLYVYHLIQDPDVGAIVLLPAANTTAASEISGTGATLNGTINPNGSAATYHFEYGTGTSYGTSTTPANLPSGSSPVGVNSTISNLLPGTTYHYKLVATNVGGDVSGGDKTFTTPIQPPTVTTTAATSITSTGATLNGTVNPSGAATTYHFEYGLTTSYDHQTSPGNIPAGMIAVNVSSLISALVPGSPYHYRLVADNGSGSPVPGGDRTFTTGPPGPWSYTNTGINHTVIIPLSANPNIGGTPLVSGDYIGAFFDSSGTLACGGFQIWNGSSAISISAFGNDVQTAVPDGFAAGEVFKWKVYRSSEGKTYDAVATYLPVSGIITNTNTYATNGISQLSSLIGYSTHTVALRTGWGIISSYVEPLQTSLDSIFKPVNSTVIIVKNGAGQAYIPSVPLNSIGPWVKTEGYQIKMSNAGTVGFAGRLIVPESTPITLPGGWSILPYLRTSESSVESALNSMVANIIIVKDQDGNTFIPSIPLNGIGNMKPGQGYQIKLTAGQVFTYLANSAPLPKRALVAESTVGTSGKPQHYPQPLPTGNNQTLVFAAGVAGQALSPGDEIAVFSSSGRIVGAGVYRGENFSVAVWGDDPTTKEKDGMVEGEKYEIRIWKREQGVELRAVDISWKGGKGEYEVNGLSVAEKVAAFIQSDFPTDAIFAQNYPNPFNPSTRIVFSLPAAGRVRLTVYNVLGQLVSQLLDEEMEPGLHQVQFDGTGLSSGLYYYRIDCLAYTTLKKMLLMK